MKKIILGLSFCSIALWASIGSSVKIPTAEHLKYTFGNHKKHPVQKLEKEQYLRQLAPMKEENIRKALEEKGYVIEGIELKDIAAELLYEIHGKNASTEHVKLYVDPSNGSVLKQESLR